MTGLSNYNNTVHKPISAVPFSAMVGLGCGTAYAGYSIFSQMATIHSPKRLAKLESKADEFVNY